MKYLAILKDSLREALDSKVLYVMLGLSGLVILVVAGISFEPVPAEEGLQDIVNHFAGAAPGFGQTDAPATYTVAHFHPETEAPEPWNGAYRLDVVVREREQGMLRLLCLASGLVPGREDATEADEATRKRLVTVRDQIRFMRPEQVRLLIHEHLKDKIDAVTDRQLEEFLTEQFAVHGTLAAEVRRASWDRTRALRFAVTARGNAETYRTWPHRLSLFFGAVPTAAETAVGPLVYQIEDNVVGTVGAAIAMLVSVIITAFFIPNMLRKGTIDLLLAKPIRRPVLLVYKFIGGLAFMFINTAVIVVGLWLVLGLRSHLWPPGFLLAVPMLTFEFAIFYAVSTLFGVLTRSPIVAILAACLTWVVLFVAGVGYQVAETSRGLKQMPDWVYTVADVTHFVLPRYKDLDLLTSSAIARGLLGPDSVERQVLEKTFGSVRWGESLGFTAGFIGMVLGLACWRFSRRDY